MKQLLLLLFVMLALGNMHAQKIGFWFDTGAKIAYGPTGLLNNNIINDSKYDHTINTGYGIGAKFGIYYGRYNGVTIDAMLNQGKQRFEFTKGEEQNNNHTINWSTIDMALLYRMQKASIYFELGPQFSFVNSVTQEIPVIAGAPTDISQFFNDQYTSAIFGFGGYVLNSNTFTLMFGMRLAYGLTDMISPDGQTAGYPNPNSENAPYKDYTPTNPVSALFVIEANYGIGYFAKTSCSDRSTFFRFN